MKTALLVVDMQVVFTPMTHNCLSNILLLDSNFKAKSLNRIYTQHGHTKEELTPPFKNQLVKRWGVEGSIAKYSPDWELMPEIKKASDGCMIIAKNTYDAFLNTDLQGVLERRGIGRVVVCGVMTDFCCDTTARSAFNRGFETLLVGDACGTANEKQHEEGLNGFRKAFGDVVKTEEVVEMLGL
ncbi:MAG: hypothetical protein Q9174_006310 [Haloplaca sp. 1 TL-2023]